MAIYQSYNSKIKAWVKYKFTKKGIRWLKVKQKNPMTPFKGITKKGAIL